ncbi:MAG: hypothetical protein RQ847_04265 [Wenzhouxiangellaceae bacterium]|nr:hypothetical protein [Wenzhouxiangellaceae bacterium]
MNVIPALFSLITALVWFPALAQTGGFDDIPSPLDRELGQPFFIPENPAVGLPFVVAVDVNGCTTPQPNPDGILSEVRVEDDQRVSVLISALEYNPICALVSPPPAPRRFIQQLPGLNEGKWTVDIFVIDPEETFPMDVSAIEPFWAAEVVVRGQVQPQPIPALSPVGLSLLMLVTVMIGIRHFRKF